MVRVNLIDSLYLTDQHLIAEYNEILMLISYLRRYPLRHYDVTRIPKRFTLGKGHMIFFKDKVLYLKRRHDSIREEMGKRGYVSRRVLSIDGFPSIMLNDWLPDEQDVMLIKSRLVDKVRTKPWFYTYYGYRLGVDELVSLIEFAIWH
ncbi:MAG: pyrimidine dimer DNA glycosylase/endonuclease V [Candidatus Nitrosocaldus sp.]